MAKIIIKKFGVNLSLKPQASLFPLELSQAFTQRSATIGDLHGNALRILYTTCELGMISISDEDYQNFSSLYFEIYNGVCTPTSIVRFNQILDNITVINPSICLRWLGDEVADRGSNDYFTLKLLQKLKRGSVNYEILFSNHGGEFVRAYETQKGIFLACNMSRDLTASMDRMNLMIQTGLVSADEVHALVEEVYKPQLNLLSYSISGDQNHISLFSHAPIGLNTIIDLAKKLGVTYQDETAVQLAQTIDCINQVFSMHVTNNTVHTLYDPEIINTNQGRYAHTAPVENIMWNRETDALFRPAEYRGYFISFIHGHHPFAPSTTHIFNLDNDFGKNPLPSRLAYEEGTYEVFLSNDNTAALAAFAQFPAPTELTPQLFITTTKNSSMTPSPSLDSIEGLVVQSIYSEDIMASASGDIMASASGDIMASAVTGSLATPFYAFTRAQASTEFSALDLFDPLSPWAVKKLQNPPFKSEENNTEDWLIDFSDTPSSGYSSADPTAIPSFFVL